MSEQFDKIVDVLNSEPKQQCVVRAEWLGELGIDPQMLGKASERSVSIAYDFISVPERSIALRDRVFVFAAKEAV